MEFEWDEAKEQRNIGTHGVDFTEARASFQDDHAFFQFDARHSLTEHRFWLLGKARVGRLLLTVFTWRGTRIRIISSRRANRREATNYEERIRLQ